MSRRNELVVLDTLPRPAGEALKGLEGKAIGTALEVAVEDRDPEALDEDDMDRVGTAGAEFRTFCLGPRDGRGRESRPEGEEVEFLVGMGSRKAEPEGAPLACEAMV